MQIILAYGNVPARELIMERARALEDVSDILSANRISEIGGIMRQCDRLRLIIVDAGLPDMHGLSGLKQVISLAKRKAANGTVRIAVAVMGLPASESEMRMVFDCGAAGYIPKTISAKSLFSAIGLLLDGEMFMPAEAPRLADEMGADKRNFLPLMALTKRERHVLLSLLRGASDKEIASAYGIALVTVKHHLRSLRAKLGAKNRTHAVCRAIELGLSQQLKDKEVRQTQAG